MDILEPYAGFVPGVIATLVMTPILGPRVGSWVGGGRVLGSALVLAIGVVLSATITPSHDALLRGFTSAGTCDLARTGLPSLNQLRVSSEIELNILLFLPLGMAIGVLPPGRAERLVIIGFALPFAIEAVQLVVVLLGRECQSGDVIDNVTGFMLGIVAGGAFRLGRAVARNEDWRDALRRARPGIRVASAALAGGVLVTSSLLTATPPADQGQVAAPTSTPVPTATPGPGESIRVQSVAALLEALADPKLREIVVADGIYRVSPAGRQAADSLWIGQAFASRTRPITVRAETPGGVTFDGGGADAFGGVWFVDGAHDQTWDGFTFANGSATSTGVIMFGEGSGVAPHHITMRNITITATVTGRARSASAPTEDHAIYISQAVDGPHDLVFEDITVDGTGGLASALHFYHSDAIHRNAWNVSVRRLHVRGTQQAILLWDGTLRDITIDTADIVDALSYAVRFESPGATGIVLANIRSTGSGSGRGFYSSLGAQPPGVTFTNDSFH